MPKLNYLYVEDDRPSQMVMGMLFGDVLAGGNLSIFEDSTDFISRLEALTPQPDVILMDIHMKPITGIEMLALLRSHPKYHSQRVIALTASVMSEEVQQLREVGFDGCIGKPVDVDTFPELIDQIEAGHSVWKII